MEVQGKIKLVGDIQEITDSFSKRELVIVTQEQYPQTSVSYTHLTLPTIYSV